MKLPRRWVTRSLLGFFVLLIFWQGWYFGWVVWWKYNDPDMTSFMRLRLEALQEKQPDATLRHIWVPYERISNHLKRAVIAAEDDTFIDHDGFDWEGIQKALKRNLKAGTPVVGGSTISQQLAKNLFLSAAKTPWRKAQEAIITVWLELLWDKRRILEVYLNSVEWGQGVFGAEAAAHRYYSISAANLSAEQAVRLAVMLPAPRRFERNPYSAFINARVQAVLARINYAEIP
jgi:monofunctional biosynthetic peptidoglycan transglycosylase